MLNRQDLKEIAGIQSNSSYFVSLYLNVSPVFNQKGDYVIHLKNMIKDAADKTEKAVYKKIKNDLEKIESFVIGSKREFKKGLGIISSSEKSFWQKYHIAVPFKNEIIIDKTPYIKPLVDILDNYKRYAVILVDKESARLFLVHLGEIEEYGEVHTPDVPGKHKMGGWFSLSGHKFERHINYHVSLHLKDVIKKLDAFLADEQIDRIVLGGPADAVSMVKGMFSKPISEKIVGFFNAEMFANVNDIHERVKSVINEYEKNLEKATISALLTTASKGENAVIGLENVLNALQERRVMKLLFLRDYKDSGYACIKCKYLTIQNVSSCPYCKGNMEDINYIIDLAAQKAIEDGAAVEVVSENVDLTGAGKIGAFLRF